MSAAVFKAIFRHDRWQTDRVVHFIPKAGDEVILAAFGALTATLQPPTRAGDYELRVLYYLGSSEDQAHERVG